MEQKFLTILTPTYNRSEKLVDLYESLKRQINKNFIWYVIDDGSEDQTEEKVSGFIEEDEFPIVYEKTQNGGKHRALNRAIPKLNSELTLIVDSDDLLLPEATDVIFNDWIENADRGIVGIMYLLGFSGFEAIGTQWPYDKLYGSEITHTINKGISGDRTKVMLTDILKKYPFPEFEGEKFCSESVVWLAIAKKHSVMTRNKIIYIARYLEDGLTAAGRKKQVNNPLGAMENAKAYLDKKIKRKIIIKNALLFTCYGLFAKKSVGSIIKESPMKLYVFLTLLPAVLLKKKWEKYLQ
jgi:glycosyltransferase involved in cell wall biosynthesis